MNYELVEIAAGRNDRLIVSMPPRHGKSETISKYFPAWLLGVRPDTRVILASYAASLAGDFGFLAREILRSNGPTYFGVNVSEQVAAREFWRIDGREGSMATVGVGGPITGKGANLLIIDDPIKNAEEANSSNQREALEQWYTSTAFSRLEPNGAVVIVMTRWNEDDLVGRRLRLEPGRWRVINLPAVAEADDPIGRPVGAALWPERYDLPTLAEIKKVQGNFWWNALYRGQPSSAGGDVFKKEWFRYAIDRGDHVGLVQPDGFERRVPKSMCQCMQFVDLAASMKTKADYFVLETDLITPWNDIIRWDVVHTRVEGPDQLGLLQQQNAKYRPGGIGVEKVGYQMTMIQAAARAGLPVFELVPDADKYTRALSLSARYQAGTVYHRRDGEWVADLEAEHLAFPNGAHDDQVDTGAYCARWLTMHRADVATASTRTAPPRYTV